MKWSEREAVNTKSHSNILIVGDFNYPAIDYLEDHVTSGSDSAAATFLDTTPDLLLFQHVEEPTRVRLGQRPSILDYIFTDNENLVDEIMYKDPLGRNDHVLLEWNLLIETVHAKSTQRKLNFCKGDYKSIAERLHKINWKSLFQNQNVKQMWSILKSIIESLSEEHLPLKLDYIDSLNPQSNSWNKEV